MKLLLNLFICLWNTLKYFSHLEMYAHSEKYEDYNFVQDTLYINKNGGEA